MKTATRKCRGCGAEETLASPFVDGECYSCIRKQQPPEPLPPVRYAGDQHPEPVGNPGRERPKFFAGMDTVLSALGMLCGLGLMIVGWNMETTVANQIRNEWGHVVSTEYVYNIGLQQRQLLAVIVGAVFFATASISLAIRSALKSRPSNP